MLTGAGSIVTLASSILATKVFALLVGPEGVGTYALLLSILNFGFLVFGVGLYVVAAQQVAASRYDARGENPARVATAAVVLATVTGGIGGVVFFTASGAIALVALGNVERSGVVAILAPAVTLTVIGNAVLGVLAGQHRVIWSTMLTSATAVAAAVIGIAIVASIGVEGFAWSLAAVSAVHAGVTVSVATRLGLIRWRMAYVEVVRHMRRLIAFGAAVMLSQAATTGAVLAMPIIVLQLYGHAEVGYYRAATAVSVGLTTIVSAGLHADFLPRIAAAPDADGRRTLVEDRMRIVLGLGVPFVLVLLAGAPMVIAVLYSVEFAPAVPLLEWQLVGDLVRLPTIILVMALIGMRARGRVVLLEILSAVSFVAASLIGFNLFGIVGAGVGYAASQFVTYVAAWIIVAMTANISPGRLHLVVSALFVGAVSLVVLPLAGLYTSLLMLATAIALGLLAAPRIARLHAVGAADANAADRGGE